MGNIIEDLKDEEWLDVVGYEGAYMVSNVGRIKILKRKFVIIDRILKPSVDRLGYERVFLSDGHDNKKAFRIHRLVAIAFIPNPYDKPHIDHIDTVTGHNYVQNLRWCTPRENSMNPITVERLKIYRDTHNNYNYGYRGTECNRFTPVAQYQKDGEFVRMWDCMEDIRREHGWCPHCISHCINGDRYSAYGFLWKRISAK